MDDFRFHMTLTGRLGSERREAVLAMLKARFAVLDLATLAIDRIACFGRIASVHDSGLLASGSSAQRMLAV
jgi:Protein of unknown function (DUF1045).